MRIVGDRLPEPRLDLFWRVATTTIQMSPTLYSQEQSSRWIAMLSRARARTRSNLTIATDSNGVWGSGRPGNSWFLPMIHQWKWSSSTASDRDHSTMVRSVPSRPALSISQMLNLEFSVAYSCVAILRHQNTSQGVRNDYQNLLEDCHACSYKNISVGWGESRNRREVCEETEQNANAEEWQRYY